MNHVFSKAYMPYSFTCLSLLFPFAAEGMGAFIPPKVHYSQKIDVFKKETQSFDLKINCLFQEKCSVIYGVEFQSKKNSSKNGPSDHIRSVFGHAMEANLPARIELSLKRVDALGISYTTLLHGKKLDYGYGSPLIFIAGRGCIDRGQYKIALKASEVSARLAEFDVKVVVESNPKISC